MKIALQALKTILENNVAEIRFARRRPKAGHEAGVVRAFRPERWGFGGCYDEEQKRLHRGVGSCSGRGMASSGWARLCHQTHADARAVSGIPGGPPLPAVPGGRVVPANGGPGGGAGHAMVGF